MKVSALAVLICTLLSLSSCGPDMPFVNMYVVSVTENGVPVGTNQHAFAPGVVIDCENGGSGCQDEADYYGGAYEDVEVVRQQLDTFYYYFYRNDLSTFYTRYDMHDFFPEADKQRPGALDSVINGNYSVRVLKDSSIAFLKAPMDSVGWNNLVFVVNRDAENKD